MNHSEFLIQRLEDGKAIDILTIDVKKVTTLMDTMIVCSGNSNRHVHALAEDLLEASKKAGFPPFGIQGMKESEWVLVDFTNIVVHILLPSAREKYRLEELWQAPHRGSDVSGH